LCQEKKMTEPEPYAPGPANLARVEKERGQNGEQNGDEKWTLVLVRELRHAPDKVWQALTDPVQLREWAPFITDGSLGVVGTVKLTWVGASAPIETKVTLVEAPRALAYGDMRWELEASGSGTRLTLWAMIDRRFVSMGAAGWHISFDVLDHLLNGTPIGRMAGGDATKFAGWQRLNDEYAKQFGVKAPSWPPNAERKS
jgi:uncharacterized protein YndB with AHSA1/START domain